MSTEEILDKISDEILDKLYKEFGMTNETRKRDVESLKIWLSKQPHLPEINDDELLEAVLFNCKNRMEIAKNKLNQYYCVRSTIPEYFINRDPCDPNLIEHINYVILPKLTKTGNRVVLIKLFRTDPEVVNMNLTYKLGIMLFEILLRKDKSAGVTIIYDSEGLTPALVSITPIRSTINVTQCLTSAFPHRLKEIHVLSTSQVAASFINFNKRFLNEKTKKKLFIHNKGSDTLFEYLEKEEVPEELGGTYKITSDEAKDLTVKLLQDNRKFFLDEENIKADMSKKPFDLNTLKPIDESELFGIEGSFRSINFD